MSDPRALEIARRELQRLGYLSHRVERFLLRDALEPVGEPRALALLAAKVGLLAGMLLFRLLYYIAPFIISVILLTLREIILGARLKRQRHSTPGAAAEPPREAVYVREGGDTGT